MKIKHFHFTFFWLSIGYLLLAYWLLIGQFHQPLQEAHMTGNNIKIFPYQPGHITDILVKENQLVVKGQPIAIVDSAAAYLQLKNAKAHLVEAIKQAKDMNEVTRLLQNKSENTLTKAKNTLTASQKNYKKLLDSDTVSSNQTLQIAQIAVEKASDAYEQAQIAHQAAMSLPLYQSINDSPIVRDAVNQLRLAYLNWRHSTLYAPDTGYVTANNIVVGQSVTLHTVLMTLMPLNQMWVNATIKKSQLKNIANGESVKLITYLIHQNKIYQGTIVGRNPREDATSTLVSVRIRINPKELIHSPLPFGSAMKATVNTQNPPSIILTHLNNKKGIPLLRTDSREKFIIPEHLIDQTVKDSAHELLPLIPPKMMSEL